MMSVSLPLRIAHKLLIEFFYMLSCKLFMFILKGFPLIEHHSPFIFYSRMTMIVALLDFNGHLASLNKELIIIIFINSNR